MSVVSLLKPGVSYVLTKGGNTRGENPRDWAKKANDIVEQYFKKEGFPIMFSTHGVTETMKKKERISFLFANHKQ